MQDEDLPQDEVRSAEEIARRALVLFQVWVCTVGVPRADVLGWLEDHGLRDALSPDERRFLEADQPTDRQTIDFSWHSERLIVLLWALSLIDRLPPPDRQCDPDVFRLYVPPYADRSVTEFISNAISRSEDELLREADRVLHLHWQAREARLNNRAPNEPVDIEVVQERHKAINWVAGYYRLDWDEVSSDT
jgi:hypothetical protein